MANKKKASIKQSTADLDHEVQYGTEQADETVIETPRGGAVAVAIRAAETDKDFRILITIRAGYGAKDIQFNFGNYGSGPIIRGGGDGDPPPCP